MADDRAALLLCEGCGKSMAEHSVLARCPRPSQARIIRLIHAGFIDPPRYGVAECWMWREDAESSNLDDVAPLSEARPQYAAVIADLLGKEGFEI